MCNNKLNDPLFMIILENGMGGDSHLIHFDCTYTNMHANKHRHFITTF